MKRGHIATGVITALGLLGLGLGLGLGPTSSAGAATTRATGVAATKSPRYVVLNCEFKAQVKPGSYVLACAEGHFHHYPALVMLWGSASVQGHPTGRHYTEVTLIYPGARPPVYEFVNGKLVATYPVTRTLPAL